MFKLTCGKCGSINILEKSGQNILDWKSDKVIYGEGIQRMCIDCSNEDFIIFRTWMSQDKNKD